MRDLFRHIRDLAHSQRGLKIGSTRFRLPPGIPIKIEEPWMRDVIEKLLPSTDGIFLDIGVNLGQTLMSLRSIDRHRRYIGFEPNPSCVAAVSQIVYLNHIQEVMLIPLACARDYGVTSLYHYQDSKFDSSASMVSNFRDESKLRRTTIIAKGAAMECLAAINADRIGLVKIDVEGFEADVLEAIEPILHRDRPLVLIEVLPMRDDPRRLMAGRRICEVMDRIGYLSQRIGKTTAGHYAGVSICGVPGSQSEVNQSDYLLASKSFTIAN